MDDDDTARVKAVRQKESEAQPNPVCQFGRVVVWIRTVAKLIHTGGEGDWSPQISAFRVSGTRSSDLRTVRDGQQNIQWKRLCSICLWLLHSSGCSTYWCQFFEVKLGRGADFTVCEVDRSGTLRWVGERGCSITAWLLHHCLYHPCPYETPLHSSHLSFTPYTHTPPYNNTSSDTH